jgi:hypothetical protein
LGNTEAIAKKSYLLVTDSDFTRATQGNAKCNAVDPQSNVKSNAASGCTKPQESEEDQAIPRGKVVFAGKTQGNQAEGTGLEPATPYGAHHFQ